MITVKTQIADTYAQLGGCCSSSVGVNKTLIIIIIIVIFNIPDSKKSPELKTKISNQNVRWLEVRQVNWQSVVQKHRVEAL